MKLAQFLTAPEICQGTTCMRFKDKRRGGIWFCTHARKITGKGRKQPPCLCRAALASERKP